jgi:phosphodiesterase/alkaline phosphatase D-like protein
MKMKVLLVLILAAAMNVAMTASAGQGAKPVNKAQAVKITDGPRVEGTGPTWAVIAWTTNTGGSTVVRYGTDANNLSQTAKAAYSDNEKTKAQNHRVHLKNLKPNTKYFFVADSGQGEGTGSEAKSPVGEFTTKAHK